MDRYKVDARLYRQAPVHLQEKLNSIGLHKGVYLKTYHNYFDTLNLILALAYYEGLQASYIPLPYPNAVFHVGGTSIGSAHTTDLLQLYIRQRFLEFINNKELKQRYAYIFDEFPTSIELRRKLPQSPEVVMALPIVETLIQHLKEIKHTTVSEA